MNFFKMRIKIFIVGLLIVFFLIGFARNLFAIDMSTVPLHNSFEYVSFEGSCYYITENSIWNSEIDSSYCSTDPDEVLTGSRTTSSGLVIYYYYLSDSDSLCYYERHLVATADSSNCSVDSDSDGYDSSEDCNDSDNTIYPGAAEICGDGIDQDCDGEDLACTAEDSDGDGYDSDNDCDDSDLTVNPGATEICGDGIDQDCDGEDLVCTGEDLDGDTFYTDTDCDDSDDSVYPGAAEICGDGIDQDCDGEDLTCTYYDNDNDGFTTETDCNDLNATIYPGADEICGDDIDQDCNGEDLSCYIDSDGDGYTTMYDCDDSDSYIYPGAIEIADDGIDQNCDGTDLITAVAMRSKGIARLESVIEDDNTEKEQEAVENPGTVMDCDDVTVDNYKFKTLMKCFIDNLKDTSLFSFIGDPENDIPTSGNSILEIDAGSYGLHEFDFSTWETSLIVIKSILVLCATWLSIKIVILKK